MKIKRTVLLEALQAVQPGLAQKELLPQSASFAFLNNEVITFNDEVAVSHPLKSDLEGAVSAKEFYALVNKVKTDEISLEIKNDELLLTGSKAKAGLRIEHDLLLPLEQLGKPEEWVELPETFSDAIKFCIFSASKNEAQAVLTCIHIIDQWVESCDNLRITSYDMGKGAKDAFPDELLIPATSAKHIANNDPIEYAVTDGWLHFRNEKGVTFSCRYFDDAYPDYSPFLDCEGSEVTFPAELPEILDRANILGDGERVTIILEKNNLIVANESQQGWYEEAIEVKYTGVPVEFDIQPEFMIGILKHNNTATIGELSLKFENDQFIHVVKILTPKAKR